MSRVGPEPEAALLVFDLGDQNNKVRLNVGGELMTTLRATLLSVPGSMLAAMVERWEPQLGDDRPGDGNIIENLDSDDILFLDRDPTIFSAILQCLRNPGTDARALAVQRGLDLASWTR